MERAKLVGINHVALEVGDVDEALEFYGRFFEVDLRGRSGTAGGAAIRVAGSARDPSEMTGRHISGEGRATSSSAMAFIDMGDQFIALAPGPRDNPDASRHFGLVVDDKERVRQALREGGVSVQATGSLDFQDPWGNNVQVVDYRDIQFTKADHVLRGMGLEGVEKTEGALRELREKGIAPE
jgi:lactoylglutathione lyase